MAMLFSRGEESELLDSGELSQLQATLRYLNQVPLNKSHPDLMVNFLGSRETEPDGERQRFSWFTDLKITTQNVEKILRAGRTRWKVENETFNTLKNQG